MKNQLSERSILMKNVDCQYDRSRVTTRQQYYSFGKPHLYQEQIGPKSGIQKTNPTKDLILMKTKTLSCDKTNCAYDLPE